MKTSFTKVFENYSLGKPSEERVHGYAPIVEILIDGTSPLPIENVLAIHSMKDTFNFETTSTILVRDDLRKEFEKQMKVIQGEQTEFLSIIKRVLGRKEYADVLSDLASIFGVKQNEIFDELVKLETEILGPKLPFGTLENDYKLFFDPDVIKVISDPKINTAINEYIETYDKLVSSSKYLRRGFNHKSAEEIGEALESKGFFGAKHGVILNDETTGTNQSILTPEDFRKVLIDDQNAIFKSEAMEKKFKLIDKEFTKKGLHNLRNTITFSHNRYLILPELKDIQGFRRKFMLSIFQSHFTEYENWRKAYIPAKREIDRITAEANKEQDKWNETLNIFRDKFIVPFELIVDNQSDVLLKESVPVISFDYEGVRFNQKELLSILSNGEKRAFYILNILFEIERKKQSGLPTVIVIDDIADSFDYQNKYAIIEYLKEVGNYPNFYLLILSHNFDFFRTSQSRLLINRHHTDLAKNHLWMVNKDSLKINVNIAQDLNPFSEIREHYHSDRRKFICAIPFVRNLIEYSRGENGPEYTLLTSLLHQKADTNAITVSAVKSIYDKYLPNEALAGIVDTDTVKTILMHECDSIKDEPDDGRIFNKIVLSIGIRILAENYMSNQISLIDNTFVASLCGNKNQTARLFKRFKELTIPSYKFRIVNKSLIAAPENIHFNSFMYEPILDMGLSQLQQIYKDLKIHCS
ncbi:hypothetical protein KBD33_06720 [Candidatus Gracilibacteria bacterium]|nr:hypothetical protein [Candidatus Gracilibacteria bacterium]